MPSLAPFGQAVSEEKIFLTLANQNFFLFLAAMFIGQMERNREKIFKMLILFILYFKNYKR
jgi:hypothetical protein